jgi:hypothetical protein
MILLFPSFFCFSISSSSTPHFPSVVDIRVLLRGGPIPRDSSTAHAGRGGIPSVGPKLTVGSYPLGMKDNKEVIIIMEKLKSYAATGKRLTTAHEIANVVDFVGDPGASWGERRKLPYNSECY